MRVNRQVGDVVAGGEGEGDVVGRAGAPARQGNTRWSKGSCLCGAVFTDRFTANEHDEQDGHTVLHEYRSMIQ